MKRKILGLLLMTTLAGLVAGCVETVDGRSTAGVPFVKDRIQGSYERSVPQVVTAARTVLKYNGQLTMDNVVNNTLEATVIHNGVGRVNVLVHVEELDAAKPITKVEVEARTRAGVPDVDLAHEIDKQIALQLVR